MRCFSLGSRTSKGSNVRHDGQKFEILTRRVYDKMALAYDCPTP